MKYEELLASIQGIQGLSFLYSIFYMFSYHTTRRLGLLGDSKLDLRF